jgi:copper chaperone CopZ
VEGVKSADDDVVNTTLEVVFDETKTTVDDIRKALSRCGYPAEGDPIFVK